MLAADFCQDFSSQAMRIRRILDIQTEWVENYHQLSEGQCKRLQVAVALWRQPDVLALDEPTNHVDADCRDRLIVALADYRGIGLLVSHDREMLDALVTQCLFLGSSAVLRPGTYSQGRSQQQADLKSLAHQRKSTQSEISRLQNVKAMRTEEAVAADAKRSKRNIAKGDKDAKGRIDLAILTGQDGKAGQRSTQIDARLAAAKQRLEKLHVDKNYSANVWLDTQPARRKLVLEMAEGCFVMGTGQRVEESLAASTRPRSDTELAIPQLQIPHLYVSPTDHIAITGQNGAGKTTLIKAILRELDANLRLLYLPQELVIDQRRDQLIALRQLPKDQQGRVLSIVAQLNSDPDRLLSGSLASPGETRKLMLAIGMLGHPQIIIMDEPTNHLDLTSTEALETMLVACPCALLLVSHDQRFLTNTTSINWQLQPAPAGFQLTVKPWGDDS
jgi:ATPase subunit of ABC transporter with duplicated ATPase domains